MTHRSGVAVSIEIMESLTEIPPAEWDALALNDPTASYGWGLAIEEELGTNESARYILARQGDELIAAVVCYFYRTRNPLFDLDRLMLGKLRRWSEFLHLSFAPAVLVGPLLGCGQKLLLSERLGGIDREKAIRRLLSELGSLAHTNGLPLHFPGISIDETELTDLLSQDGFHRTRDFPICYLDIEWSSFDGYLSHLNEISRHMRDNVKKEIRRFERAGGAIEEIEDLSTHGARLHELAEMHYQRLNGAPFPVSVRFFPRLKELLGREAVLYGAFLKSTLIGFVLQLRRGDTAYMYWIGIDRTRTKNEATYFNLLFYRPIDDAITAGLRRVYFGKTGYGTKRRRGLRTEGIQHFYQAGSQLRDVALAPWLSFHSAWMSRRVRDL